MNQFIVWLENIEIKYNVNPWIFAGLYFAGVPFFYYFIYRILICLKKGQTQKIIKWAILLGLVMVLPFLYVAIFGRNLPVWFWFVVSGIVLLSIFSVIRKISTPSTSPFEKGDKRGISP